MATFNDNDVGTSAGGTTPTYNSVSIAKPKIITVQFGDGYKSRNVFGLNQNPREFNLTFIKSLVDADKIFAFLTARCKLSESFTFTPPSETTAIQVICENYNKQNTYLNRATITATFEEVFQP